MCFRIISLLGLVSLLLDPNGVYAAEQTRTKSHSEPPASTGGIPTPVAAIINEVRPLLDKDHAETALEQLTAYKGPDHPWIQRMRADALFLTGDAAGAITVYRQLVALLDAPPGTRINLARALAASGDHHAAAEELSNTLSGGLDPHASAADLALFMACLLQAGQPNRALTLSEVATLRFPDDAQLQRTHIAALQACERWSDLAALAQSMLRTKPSDELGWAALVSAREHLGDHDELATVVVAAEHHHAIPVERVALDLDRSGLRAAALPYYKQAINGGQVTWALIQSASNAALASNEPAMASGFLAKLSKEDAQRPDARRLAALSAVRAGHADAAREQLIALITEGHATGDVYLWAGRLAEDAHDLAAAADLYERASTFTEQSRSGHLAAALVLGKLHQLDGAHAQVQAVLEHDPHDRYATDLGAWLTGLDKSSAKRDLPDGSGPKNEKHTPDHEQRP